jgi:hypothetical protein
MTPEPVKVGRLPELLCVAFPAFPDLSFHCVTDEPLKVIELESAPSNHNARPGILCGENAEYALLVPRIVGIGYLV